MRALIRVLALGLAVAIAPPAFAAALVSADTPPDTGLFAPVAEQLQARLTRLAGLPSSTANAERLMLLLETGQADEAARIAPSIEPMDAASIVARVRVALAAQDFATAGSLMEMLSALQDPDARSTRYRYEYARDASAMLDSLTRARLITDPIAVPELLVAGRLAYDQLDYARGDSLFSGVLAAVPATAKAPSAHRSRSYAHLGRALVMQKRRNWDGSLAELTLALADYASADVLEPLAQTLIRLGRTDEAISAAQWGVRLDPYHDPSHYVLGNGYTRAAPRSAPRRVHEGVRQRRRTPGAQGADRELTGPRGEAAVGI